MSNTWLVLRNPKNAGSRVMVTAVSNIILSGMALVTGTLAARLLGPDGRGQLAAMQVWALLFFRIATAGLPDSIIYFVARQPKRGESYLATAIVLSLILAIPAIVAGYALMPVVLASHPPRVVDSAQLYISLFVPLFALVNLPIHALRGRNEFLPWNALNLLRHGGWLAVLIIGWLIPTYDPVTIAYLQLAALTILALINFVVVLPRLGGSLKPDARMFKPMLRFGIPSALSNTSELVNLRIDQLVLSGILGPTRLGLYVAAVGWGLGAKPILTAVGNVLFPKLAGEAQPRRQADAFVSGVKTGVALAALLGMCFLALTPLAVPFLFGERFREATGPAYALVVSGTLWGVNGIIEEGLRGLGRPGVAMKAELVGVAFTAALLAALVPAFNILGAATATLGGFAASAVFLFRSASKITGVPMRILLTPDLGQFFRAIRQMLQDHGGGQQRD